MTAIIREMTTIKKKKKKHQQMKSPQGSIGMGQESGGRKGPESSKLGHKRD